MELNKEAVVSFLKQVNIMTLALAGERGPISTPVLFAVEDDLSKLYFATHRDTFKARALLKDPRVSASIWQFDQMLVQLDGTVKEVVGSENISDKVDKLAVALSRLNDFWPPILQIEGDGYIVFEITPTWVRSLDLSNHNIKTGDNPFSEIQL